MADGTANYAEKLGDTQQKPIRNNRFKKSGNDIKEEFTKSWKIYLDDCFIFWKCPWGDINELRNQLQTMEHSSKELSFLDIFIKNVNGQIITDINHKPTDT